MDIDSKNEEIGSTSEEPILEEKNENTSGDGKRTSATRTIAIVVLLLLAPAYLFYKTMFNSSSTSEAAKKGVDIAAYENAANTNPTFSNLLDLSFVYINNGMAGKAIEPLNKAIAIDSKSASAYGNLGFAYALLGRYKEGIAACEKAIQIDSTFQLAKNNLNMIKGEQKKELDIIEELAKKPENEKGTFYYTGLGLHYLKLEDYDKGIENFNKVLKIDPKNSAGLIDLGIAYMSKQQYEDAAKYFQKATEADPNDQLAKNNLAWALSEKKKVDDLQKK